MRTDILHLVTLFSVLGCGGRQFEANDSLGAAGRTTGTVVVAGDAQGGAEARVGDLPATGASAQQSSQGGSTVVGRAAWSAGGAATVNTDSSPTDVPNQIAPARAGATSINGLPYEGAAGASSSLGGVNHSAQPSVSCPGCAGRPVGFGAGGSGLTGGGAADFGTAGVGSVRSAQGCPATAGAGEQQPPAIAIDAGYYVSCSVRVDGTIWCWGRNEYGQLGIGTTVDSPVPVSVSGIADAAMVSLGGYQACALSRSGSVQCWGGYRGEYMPSKQSDLPVTIPGISQATSIAVGSAHACALLRDGRVVCWGDNYSGSLGNGAPDVPEATPVGVEGIENAVAISAEYFQTCAVLSSGLIQCWGSNRVGQLGDGTLTNSSVPVTVSGISDAQAVAVGFEHSCALLKDGTVRCWGFNRCGQLGNGTTLDSLLPVKVTGITDATAIDATSSQTCALLRDGTIRCWGVNETCIMTNAVISEPVVVQGASNASIVAAGYQHSCLIAEGGVVQCWGYNYANALGDGSNAHSASPVTVCGF